MARYRKDKKKDVSGTPRYDGTGASRKREAKEASNNTNTNASTSTTSGESDQSQKPTGHTGMGSARTANDPEWYNADPALLLDSASFPFSYPLGDALPSRGEYLPVIGKDGQVWSWQDQLTTIAIPGVCSLAVKPTIGSCADRKDPANVCASAFYTHVRYVNSGRKNYDPSDLMMYALAIADLYSFIFFCQRLYGYMFTYSQRNKYIAQALVKANGVNYDDLRSNLANFRYWLNSFINKVSSWVVPSNINYFKRRAFMYSGLYLENPDSNVKDQLYQFVPDGFYQFNIDSATKFGKLTYIRWLNKMPSGTDNTGKTVSDIINFGESLIENITGDEDFGLMSGDILKAYGENIIGLGSCPEEVYVIPVHDKYVLSQFKNATKVKVCAGHTGGPTFYHLSVNYTRDSSTYASGDIMQDALGNLICEEIPEILVAGTEGLDYMVAASNHVMSIENPIPGPADSIEASRLMVGVGDVKERVKYNDQLFNALIYGSEIVQHIIVSTFDGTGALVNEEMDSYFVDNETSANNVALRIAPFFKYVPLIMRTHFNTVETTHRIGMTIPWGNIDNYTMVGAKEIAKMHECALLSLFFVPGVAKMINYMK